MLLMGGCQVDAKRDIAQEVALHYHKMGPQFDEDAPGGDLLKPVIPANAQNNTQNFFHWNQRSSMEGKANFMDTLPAIISAMPKDLARKMLNRFLFHLVLRFQPLSAGESGLIVMNCWHISVKSILKQQGLYCFCEVLRLLCKFMRPLRRYVKVK